MRRNARGTFFRPELSANRTGTMFIVCERLVPPRAAAVYIVRRITFRVAKRRYPAGWEHSLDVWRVTYHNHMLTQTVAYGPRRRNSCLGSLL